MENFVSSPFADIRVAAEYGAARGDGWRQPPPPKGDPSFTEIMGYRFSMGWDNNITNNLLSTDRLDGFVASMKRKQAYPKAHYKDLELSSNKDFFLVRGK